MASVSPPEMTAIGEVTGCNVILEVEPACDPCEDAGTAAGDDGMLATAEDFHGKIGWR